MATGETKTQKKKIGRPQKYSKALGLKVCAELAMGKSLKSVCEITGMPAKTTVFRWLSDLEEFRDLYARAKEEAADAMAEEIQDISDETAVDRDHIAKAKLRIDTRKFLMAKMKPKRYGDKLDVTSGGEKLPTPIYGGQSGDSGGS